MSNPASAGVTSFSLLDEPWIPVHGANGARELSLLEVFAESAQVQQVTGEVPTQTFATMRLLLAITRRALGTDLVDEESWAELWNGGFPAARVSAYLEAHRDRFDLLDQVAPFYQAPGVHTAKHEMKDLTPLLFDVPSNNRLFTTRSGRSLERISYAEAARWLVHAQAFDISGIKSGLVGDDRVRGGRGYPIGTGWAGAIGGVLVEGGSLSETLLLNLKAMPEEIVAFDLAPWEREPDSAAARRNAQPRGPVDLLTWQARRIRLVHDGAWVTGCVLGNGDPIAPQNQFKFEHMTAWRYSEPQSKKFGHAVFMPRGYQDGRALWRGVNGLMARQLPAPGGKDGPRGFAPGVLEWIAELQEKDLLPIEQRVAVRALGVLYGSQSSVVSEIFDDTVFLPLVALDEQGETQLAAAVKSAVAATDAAIRSYGHLARNLALAAGSSRDESAGPQEAAQAEGYAAVDHAFRDWLAGLDPKQDPVEQADTWKWSARKILRGLGGHQINSAAPRAWTGRTVDLGMGGGVTFLCTSIAESKFQLALELALAPIGRPADMTESNTGGTE